MRTPDPTRVTQALGRSAEELAEGVDLRGWVRAAASFTRRIHHADLEVSVPLTPGSLLPGLQVKPGTVARIAVSIRAGRVEFERARVELLPGLDGPLFIAVQGMAIGSDGRVALRIRGLPDVHFGPRLPGDVGALADLLEQSGPPWRLPIHVLGFRVGAVKVQGEETLEEAERLAKRHVPGTPRLSALRIHLAHAELEGGRLDLPPPFDVALRDGCRIRVEGTGDSLVATAELDLASSSGEVQPVLQWADAQGALRVVLEMVRGEGGSTLISARAEELGVQWGRFELRLDNGDFLVARRGGAKGGFVQVDVASGEQPVLSGRIEQGELEVERGRVSAQLGDRIVPIVLGGSRYAGMIALEGRRLKAEGEAEVEGSVEDFRTQDQAVSLRLDRAKFRGPVRVDYDSSVGFTLRSNEARAQVTIAAAAVRGWKGRVRGAVGGDTRADVTLRFLRVSRDGRVRVGIGGEAFVDVERFGVRTRHLTVDSNDVTFALRGPVIADTDRGFVLGRGTLKIDAGSGTVSLALDGGRKATARGRLRLAGPITSGILREDRVGVTLRRGTTWTLDAVGGRLDLSDGRGIELLEGTRFDAELERLWFRSGGDLALDGRVHALLRARGDGDLSEVLRLPGFRLTSIDGVTQQLELSTDRLLLCADGTFELHGLRCHLDADVADFTGQL